MAYYCAGSELTAHLIHYSDPHSQQIHTHNTIHIYSDRISTEGGGEREMKKKINLILKKCKTLSRQLSRTSSYSSLRSKSARHNHHHHLDTCGSDPSAAAASQMMMVSQVQDHEQEDDGEKRKTILVGSKRRRFSIKSKYLEHPLVKAIIEEEESEEECLRWVRCEVVLFDHLLWMLDNADSTLIPSDNMSLEELVDPYLV